MKTLTIYRCLLPAHNRKIRYLYDGHSYDYLGQLITQLHKGPLPEKCRFPSDLDFTIPPFSFPLRGVVCNTELTISILRLDYLDPSTHEIRLNTLLAPHNLSVVFRSRLPTM